MTLNPIELLQLNYYESSRITQDTIQGAANRLKVQINSEAVTYQGQVVTEVMIDQAVTLLQSEEAVRSYYYMATYPGLAAFLQGNNKVEVETESLAVDDPSIKEHLLQILSPKATETIALALDGETVDDLLHFGRQLNRAGGDFQGKVYADGKAILKSREDRLWQLLKALKTDKALEHRLQSLQLFREQIPIKVLNALPDTVFSDQRQQIIRALGHIVHYLSKENPTLALAVARYAVRIQGDPAYREKLSKVIQQLSLQSGGNKKNKEVGVSTIISAIVILVILGAGVYYFGGFDKNLLAGDNDRKPSESYGSEEIEWGPEVDASYTRYLNLIWYERGAASADLSSGIVEKGSTPLIYCFPTIRSRGTMRKVTIVGDASHDALVFFFNGKDYIDQAFIPSKSRYILEKPMKGGSLSTMIIFGKDWDENASSPCGSPGYFTNNVHYGGFAAYATDPPYIEDVVTQDVLYLKKKRLMPSREKGEDEFFQLLEKYR